MVNKKRLQRIDLTERELQNLAGNFKMRVKETTEARNQHNLEKEAYVPQHFFSRTTVRVIQASQRLKKAGAKQRAKEQQKQQEEEVRAHFKQKNSRVALICT